MASGASREFLSSSFLLLLYISQVCHAAGPHHFVWNMVWFHCSIGALKSLCVNNIDGVNAQSVAIASPSPVILSNGP
jgi:hypothetical protein